MSKTLGDIHFFEKPGIGHNFRKNWPTAPNKLWYVAIKIPDYNMNYQVIFAKELKRYDEIKQKKILTKKKIFLLKKTRNPYRGSGTP